MSDQDHLKICGYCKADKLAELGAMVRGTKAASSSSVTTAKSYPSDRMNKLRELAKIIKGE